MAVQKATILTQDQGMRLLNWLKRYYKDVPFNHIHKWMRTGQIRLGGKRVKGSEILQGGDELRLPPYIVVPSAKHTHPKKALNFKRLTSIQEAIIEQNQHWLLLNKPAGLATQGGTGIKECVDDIMATLFTPAPKLTHRLDKDTSGLLLLAKDLETARWLTSQFKEGRVQKTYIALVVGIPQQERGQINVPLCKMPGKAGERMVVDYDKGLEALTYYQVLETKNNLSLLELKPQTGRMHQLRLHCAEIGTPILGDGKYGGKKAHPYGERFQLHLHAQKIEFTAMSGEQHSYEAPLPLHMITTLERLCFKSHK